MHEIKIENQNNIKTKRYIKIIEISISFSIENPIMQSSSVL